MQNAAEIAAIVLGTIIGFVTTDVHTKYGKNLSADVNIRKAIQVFVTTSNNQMWVEDCSVFSIELSPRSPCITVSVSKTKQFRYTYGVHHSA